MSRMNFNTTHGNNGTLYELMLDRKRANMSIDLAISRALKQKKKFNERSFANWDNVSDRRNI